MFAIKTLMLGDCPRKDVAKIGAGMVEFLSRIEIDMLDEVVQ